MDIYLEVMSDMKKGDRARLNIDSGELHSLSEHEKMILDSGVLPMGLQPKEEPNIIEDGDHSLDGLLR